MRWNRMILSAIWMCSSLYYTQQIKLCSPLWMVASFTIETMTMTSKTATPTRTTAAFSVIMNHPVAHHKITYRNVGIDTTTTATATTSTTTNIHMLAHQPHHHPSSPRDCRPVETRRRPTTISIISSSNVVVLSTFVIGVVFFFGSIFLFPSASHAVLDMEAFAAQQSPTVSSLSSTTSSRSISSNDSRESTTTAATTSNGSNNNMSADEALCRFGQPGLLKGDACVRANLSIAPKTKNGVDAYGNLASRSTYAKCTKQYTLVDNNYYTSEWICQ